MSNKNNRIIAAGIDSVTISRFESWINFDKKQLSKIFSHEEIEYARLNENLFAQRLAVRFAAKEAFLKALQQIYPQKVLNFLTVAKALSVSKNQRGLPSLTIDWKVIMIEEPFEITVSLTHEKCHATAIVIIYD